MKRYIRILIIYFCFTVGGILLIAAEAGTKQMFLMGCAYILIYPMAEYWYKILKKLR